MLQMAGAIFLALVAFAVALYVLRLLGSLTAYLVEVIRDWHH